MNHRIHRILERRLPGDRARPSPTGQPRETYARRFPVLLLLGFLLPCCASATALGAVSRVGPVPGIPVRLDRRNRRLYHSVLPTGRRVSPVGIIVSTPNFPTAVVASHDTFAVLANGATPFQTITWYDGKLERLVRLAAFPKSSPETPVAIATPGGSGIALDPSHTGAAGEVYTTNQSATTRMREAREALAAGESPETVPTTILPHADLFQGLSVGPHGVWYAAGGASDSVYALRPERRGVAVLRQYPLRWVPFPQGQYPYVYQGDHLKKPWLFYPDSIAVGSRGRHLYVTGLLANALARITIATGRTRYVNAGPFPFAVVSADHGRRLVVSDWGGSGVTVIDRKSFRILGRVPTGRPLRSNRPDAGSHPTALLAVPGTADVWVADANSDVLTEIDVRSLEPVRRIHDVPYRGAPPGSYPDALAWDRGHLLVANAGNDDVAVYDPRNGHLLGLIPTGWYPTSLTVSGHRLAIVAAKGFGTGPNRAWQYIGTMMHGLLQEVDLRHLSRHLPRWTRETLKNDGFTASDRRRLARRNARMTSFLRRHIHYVVFILRENKTFDEDLGDDRAAGAWADPHFDLYGPRELPNLYDWAAHDVLFADFMADGEVTAQGHQWVDGASDSDVVQRLWPEYYSNRGLLWNAGPGGSSSLEPGAPGSHDPYQYSRPRLGNYTNPWVSYPWRLYLFNDFLRHGVSFEDFGEDLSRERDGTMPSGLLAHVDRTYPGWDRMILDATRVKALLDWLRHHHGRTFPHFLYVWLPDDHTAGLTPCYYTPDYYVAENDQATAELLHALSELPEWRHMVVFLTEDDAQSGADHINAHRTFAVALGPWVKKGFLETAPYSQVNIVRTIEAIFGLPPMSQWDANARVISGIWLHHPRRDAVPVLPMEVPVAFNPGMCPDHRLLRREAGATGHRLTARWLRMHTDVHGHDVSLEADEEYSPVSLLKVPGPVQLREEWIASKGRKAYAHFMHELRAYARLHGAPVESFEAGDGGDPP